MKHLIPTAMFNRKYGAEMAWSEKQKKAIEDEIAMFRRNGETSIGGLSNAITEAADCLENEVLNDDHD